MILDNIHITLATPHDSQAIAELLYVSFLEIKAVYTQGGFEATVLNPELVEARMLEGPIWIAFENEQVVGTVSAVFKTTGCYLRGMAVHPECRGKQIGNKLLETVEHFAIQSHCERIFLSTAPYLTSAIRLYTASGFTRIDDPPYELHGTPLFSMEKRLI